MRTRNSIINLITALIGQIIGILAALISRVVFLKCLPIEYLGLSGLFTNILTIFSLVELGIGPAINFALYKPLAEKDNDKVKALMSLYKKAYISIGVIILILGIVFIPYYKFFIQAQGNIKNLDAIYFLYVLNTAVSYFFHTKDHS